METSEVYIEEVLRVGRSPLLLAIMGEFHTRVFEEKKKSESSRYLRVCSTDTGDGKTSRGVVRGYTSIKAYRGEAYILNQLQLIQVSLGGTNYFPRVREVVKRVEMKEMYHPSLTHYVIMDDPGLRMANTQVKLENVRFSMKMVRTVIKALRQLDRLSYTLNLQPYHIFFAEGKLPASYPLDEVDFRLFDLDDTVKYGERVNVKSKYAPIEERATRYSDLESLGYIFLELMTGFLPWKEVLDVVETGSTPENALNSTRKLNGGDVKRGKKAFVEGITKRAPRYTKAVKEGDPTDHNNIHARLALYFNILEVGRRSGLPVYDNLIEIFSE